ncbi:MAG: ComEA family DNA-binding protein [Desulfohalobiaceae bacterium]
MGFLNIGNKDEHGKQRRIEHRGKYLRASRTGGVALRAQAKALGANLTANTNRGFRVSTTPLKNTQIALQNGRFVLRGRYGSGPLKLNLSKTGVTASSRNRLGSFNWIKPNRSSAKLFGVQLRGRKAANLQLVYMGLAAILTLAGLLLKLAMGVFWVLAWALDLVYRSALAAPYALRMLGRRFRNYRLSKNMAKLESELGNDLDAWRQERLIAGALLILAAWGREREATEEAVSLQQAIAEAQQVGPLQRCQEDLEAVAQSLEDFKQGMQAGPDLYLGVLAMIATRLAGSMSEQELPEVLLQADEIVLRQGERTVLQERMLEVFGDFANLQLQEAEGSEPAREATESAEEARTFADSGPARAQPDQESLVDLNTASLQELQSIPHIGPERAQEIIERRPFSAIEELQEIDGIGPQRLEVIREYVVLNS